MIGNWNITQRKECELVEEAKQYSLDVVGISSNKRRGSNTVELDDGWKLFCPSSREIPKALKKFLNETRKALNKTREIRSVLKKPLNETRKALNKTREVRKALNDELLIRT